MRHTFQYHPRPRHRRSAVADPACARVTVSPDPRQVCHAVPNHVSASESGVSSGGAGSTRKYQGKLL